jgi:hypothetical protein
MIWFSLSRVNVCEAKIKCTRYSYLIKTTATLVIILLLINSFSLITVKRRQLFSKAVHVVQSILLERYLVRSLYNLPELTNYQVAWLSINRSLSLQHVLWKYLLSVAFPFFRRDITLCIFIGTFCKKVTSRLCTRFHVVLW